MSIENRDPTKFPETDIDEQTPETIPVDSGDGGSLTFRPEWIPTNKTTLLEAIRVQAAILRQRQHEIENFVENRGDTYSESQMTNRNMNEHQALWRGYERLWKQKNAQSNNLQSIFDFAKYLTEEGSIEPGLSEEEMFLAANPHLAEDEDSEPDPTEDEDPEPDSSSGLNITMSEYFCPWGHRKPKWPPHPYHRGKVDG